MRVHVALAGVADIRYPLHDIEIETTGELKEEGFIRRILSPYDEGALELALKLRDAEPTTEVCVYLISGANNESILRSIAAHKPDHLEAVELTPCCPWDAELTGAQFAALFEGNVSEDSVFLVGREFGDTDPGNFPAALAANLKLPLLARVQYLERHSPGALKAMRQRGTQEEWTRIDEPAVLSITNDKRNKLRHPLMKNVMLAKRMTFLANEAPRTGVSNIRLSALKHSQPASRSVECTLLTGTTSEMAESLAVILREHLE